MDLNGLTENSPLVIINEKSSHGDISRTSPTWTSSHLKVIRYYSQ